MPVDVSVLTALEATAAYDDFNYTESPISNGGQWTSSIITDDLPLESNFYSDNTVAPSGAVNTQNSSFRNERTWGPSMAAMLTVVTKSDDGDVGLYIGLQGSGLGSGTPDGYLGEVRTRGTDDEWRIQRADAGVLTVLSSGTFQEISSGDKFAVVRNGNDIELWWKTGSTWTFIVGYNTGSDSPNYTSAGKVGITIVEISDSGARYDDLKVMDLAATPTAAAESAAAGLSDVARGIQAGIRAIEGI